MVLTKKPQLSQCSILLWAGLRGISTVLSWHTSLPAASTGLVCLEASAKFTYTQHVFPQIQINFLNACLMTAATKQ